MDLKESTTFTDTASGEVAAEQTEAERLVRYYALGAAGLSAIPIPFLDMALLTGVQLLMLRSLAQKYGVPFSEQAGKAALASLISLSVPVATWSMVKLIPGIGQFLGIVGLSAIAGAATYATGKVFIQHFESGGTFLTLDPAKVKDYYTEQYKRGRSVITKGASDLKP